MQTEPLSGSKLWVVGWGYNEKHANNISRLSATNRSVHLQTGSDLAGRLNPQSWAYAEYLENKRLK